MNKRNRLPVLAISIVIVIASAIFSWASGGLLSPGATKITSDSSMSFCLNLSNLSEEIKGEGLEYAVSLKISPQISQMSVRENIGSINPVSGEYQVNSTQLDGTDKLHFTISPDANIKKDTVYTVAVSVVGSGGSANDSFEFTAVASIQGPTNQEPNNNAKKQQGQSMKVNMSNGISTTVTETVTYAGSWDNYLDRLSVTDYEFTRKFYKTRDTYFTTVPLNVSEVEVNATASDSSAIVAIAGNEELKTGMNKILISVTADDGSVRTYRIYVDKKSMSDTEGDNENSEN